jgi:hypothetical protein
MPMIITGRAVLHLNRRIEMKKKTQRITEIPHGSALAPLQRKGTEGACLACGQLIRAHYGHRNTWMGCQAKGLAPDTPFLLVPARRQQDYGLIQAFISTAGNGDKTKNGAEKRAEIKDSYRMPRRREVVYVADGRIKADKFTSFRLQQVYGAVKAEPQGLSRKKLLKKLHASKRPGTINSAVRRLVMSGALKSKPLEAFAEAM